MRLVLLHPRVAARPCAECRRWLYPDRPGDFAARPLERPAGRPVPRPPASPPPCRWCPKVPEGAPPVPESAQELSPKNARAYLHYLECKATGSFPDDPLVRRNAAAIRQAEDACAEARTLGRLELIAELLRRGLGG